MPHWWSKWTPAKPHNEAASTSEEVFDSDMELDHEDMLESPTLVTVDDGKGGIKHIKVSRPLEGQAESEFSCNNSLSGRRESARSKMGLGLGDMVRKELAGKHFLNFEPHHEKLRKRIVSKKGHINIGKVKVSKRRRRFLSDIFNTLLDMKWRYVHILFFFSFIGSWMFFAGICVETQHTIGYGGRQTTEECPEAIFIMSVQSIVGVMIQACMVGIIFSKLSRPKKRAATLMFSKNAVICQRDGINCLLFRVGNMRLSSLVEAHVRAILISKKVTAEGEVMPYAQTELTIGTDCDGEEDELFFIWPTTLIHKITPDSPFYDMSAKDFLKKRYEIVVILEGVVEQTGNSIQARSSYLPNEVLWGYRFANLLTFKHSASEYKIDYSAFNSVYKTELTPLSQKVKEAEIMTCLQVSISDELSEGDKETECESPAAVSPHCNCVHSPVSSPPTPSFSSRSTAQLYPVMPLATPTPDQRLAIPDTNSRVNSLPNSDNKKYCVEILHMV